MAEQGELRPWEQILTGFYTEEPGCAQKLFGCPPRPSSQTIFRRGCGRDSPLRPVAVPEMIEHEDTYGR